MMQGTSRRVGAVVLALGLLAVVPGAPAQAGPGAASAPTTQTAPTQRAISRSEADTPVNAVPEKKAQEQDENEAFRHSEAVQKLGHLIGLNPDQAATAFTVFNFLVLLFGVGYVALKTLPRTFRSRSSAIQRHLVDARTATEEATARLSSVEQRLTRLDDQIAGLRAQAEADAEREEQRIRASLEEESKKIIAAAESEIAAATATARRSLQSYAADLAIEQAARRFVITAEADRLLVEDFAAKLGQQAGATKGVEN